MGTILAETTSLSLWALKAGFSCLGRTGLLCWKAEQISHEISSRQNNTKNKLWFKYSWHGHKGWSENNNQCTVLCFCADYHTNSLHNSFNCIFVNDQYRKLVWPTIFDKNTQHCMEYYSSWFNAFNLTFHFKCAKWYISNIRHDL